jgi:hypothetical protein
LAGVDLSGIPEGLWLAVRQYLARMRQLDPQVGWAMGERLAADVAARLALTVPPQTPSAAFLAAVVAERQARDAQRVFGAPRPAGPFPVVAPTAARVEFIQPIEQPPVPGTGFAPPA